MWKKILIGVGSLLFILLVLSYFVFQTGLYSAKETQKGKLALTGGNFITMASDQPQVVSDSALVMEDGKIVGFRHPKKLPENIETTDLNGDYVMPGLMDLHVHLGGVPLVEDFSTVDIALEFMRQYPKSRKKFLEYGVTTIQSLGDMHPQIIDLRDKISNNELAGPRIFAAGPILTAPGGHPVSTIYQGRDRLIENAARQLDDAARAREVINNLADDSVDKIKVVYTAGPDSSLPRMRYDVLNTIVDEAHNRELRIVAHINSRNDIEDVMQAGVDGIEHFAFDMEEAPSLLKKMAANELYMVPTLSVYKSFLDSTKFSGVLEMFSNWIDDGIIIALGTDTGNIPAGESVYKEMKTYFNAGMRPYNVLQTATINAARHIQAEDELGSLESGKRADIIAFDENPLENISSLGKPSWVFKEGTAYISPR